ncbi:UDP-N-acetylglucosamine 2-epimerase [Bacteriovoracales bacterium]|nr:UDP-N-acetylglucosamine 2-epimerase [Bacteriovoracales bacterium]
MKIGVITTSRADFGIYLPLLEKIKSKKLFELKLYAGGSHVEKSLGYTVDEIIEKGFRPIILPPVFGQSFSPLGISNNMGNSLKTFAQAFSENPADFVICLGDRYEMMAYVLALIPFNIPLAHIHGGEETEGAIDNKFRHALTQLCDYHFVSCEKYKERVIQMKGFPQKVFNIGSLSLDKLDSFRKVDYNDFQKRVGFSSKINFGLVTFHPTTLESFTKNKKDVEEFIEALILSQKNYLITLPNADTYGDYYRKAFINLNKKNPSKYFIVESLGADYYFNALTFADFMIGNSSSGIIEAASFNLPVINIGIRQKGRESSQNTLHVKEDKNSILKAIKKVQDFGGQIFFNIYKNKNRKASDELFTFLEQKAQ